MDLRHTHATILPTHIIERDPRITIKQATPEKGSLSHPGHHCSPESPSSSLRGSSTFLHPIASLFHLSKPWSTSRSSSGCRRSLELCRRELRRIRILQRGKRVDFEPTRMHYLIFYSAMDFGCSPASACTQCCSQGLISLVVYARLRCRIAEVCSLSILKRHSLTASIVVQE